MKLLLIILCTFLSLSLKSQIIEAGAIAAGKIVLGDLIEKFKMASIDILGEGQRTGNALITRAGNELNVAALNLDIIFKDDLKKTFDHLDQQTSKLLVGVDQFRLAALKISNGIYDIKESTVLDLKRVLGDLHLTQKINFYIESIHGITQLSNSAQDYIMNIHGIGFGFDASNFKTKVIRITLNDSIELKVFENKIEANKSTISLNREVINKYCSNKNVTTFKISIETKVSRLNGIVFKSWKDYTYKLPINLTIIPDRLPLLTVKYIQPVYDWVTIHPNQIYPWRTEDHHQEGSNIREFSSEDNSHVLPTNQRYVNLRKDPIARTPDGANYSCSHTRWLDLHLEEGDRRIHAKFLTSSGPCNYTYGADIQEYKQTGTHDDIQSLENVKYDGLIEIIIPNKATNWSINGFTIDSKPIQIIGATSNTEMITYKNQTDDGTYFHIVYSVGSPFK